eukprot:271265-Rhodomonas_salina.6
MPSSAPSPWSWHTPHQYRTSRRRFGITGRRMGYTVSQCQTSHRAYSVSVPDSTYRDSCSISVPGIA